MVRFATVVAAWAAAGVFAVLTPLVVPGLYSGAEPVIPTLVPLIPVVLAVAFLVTVSRLFVR